MRGERSKSPDCPPRQLLPLLGPGHSTSSLCAGGVRARRQVIGEQGGGTSEEGPGVPVSPSSCASPTWSDPVGSGCGRPAVCPGTLGVLLPDRPPLCRPHPWLRPEPRTVGAPARPRRSHPFSHRLLWDPSLRPGRAHVRAPPPCPSRDLGARGGLGTSGRKSGVRRGSRGSRGSEERVRSLEAGS